MHLDVTHLEHSCILFRCCAGEVVAQLVAALLSGNLQSSNQHHDACTATRLGTATGAQFPHEYSMIRACRAAHTI